MSKAKPSTGTWKTVTAWCPLCWWKVKEEFHFEAEDGVRARMIQKHKEDKPNCHERIRIEGK